jgi:hypothetical protein
MFYQANTQFGFRLSARWHALIALRHHMPSGHRCMTECCSLPRSLLRCLFHDKSSVPRGTAEVIQGRGWRARLAVETAAKGRRPRSPPAWTGIRRTVNDPGGTVGSLYGKPGAVVHCAGDIAWVHKTCAVRRPPEHCSRPLRALISSDDTCEIGTAGGSRMLQRPVPMRH